MPNRERPFEDSSLAKGVDQEDVVMIQMSKASKWIRAGLECEMPDSRDVMKMLECGRKHGSSHETIISDLHRCVSLDRERMPMRKLDEKFQCLLPTAPGQVGIVEGLGSGLRDLP